MSSAPVFFEKEHKFAELVKGLEDKYPVLARAAQNEKPATNLWVEWVTRDGRERNRCQIVREQSGLHAFLGLVEKILTYGTPSESETFGTCGGYRHFLERDLSDDDALSLRVLRQPRFQFFTHLGWDREGGPVPLEEPVGEWKAEFALEVVPA